MEIKKQKYKSPGISIIELDFQVVCIGDSLGDSSEKKNTNAGNEETVVDPDPSETPTWGLGTKGIAPENPF